MFGGSKAECQKESSHVLSHDPSFVEGAAVTPIHSRYMSREYDDTDIDASQARTASKVARGPLSTSRVSPLYHLAVLAIVT